MDPILRARIRGQAGLVTRGQAIAAGLTDSAIEWRCARGRWVRVHPGVYLTTPGRDEWEMRAIAALLYAGSGAALCGRSAGYEWGLTRTAPSTIEVLVPEERRVRSLDSVAVRRSRHTQVRTHSSAWPHRIVAEHTVFDLAHGDAFDRAIELAARAIGLGVASEESLRAALGSRFGQSHATLLAEVLTEVGAGAESPAEVRYVRDGERAHGLPTGRRQAPTGDGGRRDVDYDEWGVIVEVDGRLSHEGWRARQREGRRDRRAATTGRLTVRCHWPDLAPTACELALDLAAIFLSRGWRGRPRSCRAGCPVGLVRTA